MNERKREKRMEGERERKRWMREDVSCVWILRKKIAQLEEERVMRGVEEDEEEEKEEEEFGGEE